MANETTASILAKTNSQRKVYIFRDESSLDISLHLLRRLPITAFWLTPPRLAITNTPILLSDALSLHPHGSPASSVIVTNLNPIRHGRVSLPHGNSFRRPPLPHGILERTMRNCHCMSKSLLPRGESHQITSFSFISHLSDSRTGQIHHITIIREHPLISADQITLFIRVRSSF